jgi:hypothetical protein
MSSMLDRQTCLRPGCGYKVFHSAVHAWMLRTLECYVRLDVMHGCYAHLDVAHAWKFPRLEFFQTWNFPSLEFSHAWKLPKRATSTVDAITPPL